MYQKFEQLEIWEQRDVSCHIFEDWPSEIFHISEKLLRNILSWGKVQYNSVFLEEAPIMSNDNYIIFHEGMIYKRCSNNRTSQLRFNDCLARKIIYSTG